MKHLNSLHNERLQAYLLNYTENELRRHSTQEEEIVFKEIENGDVEAVKRRIETANIKEELESRIGKMASRPEKSLEYMTCISIALASRAAVRGGVEHNISYTLTDLFLHYLEQCTSVAEIISLQKDAMLIFAELVKSVQEGRSHYAYVELAKNYIARHLNKKFTLDDLAGELNINKYYLSRRFSEETGVGIMKYTQQKRIDAAKNMLRFSDAPIPRIASYLCFTTQSIFGKVFKEFTGTTPGAYRNKVLSSSDPYMIQEGL